MRTSEGWLYIVVRVLPEQDWAYVLKDNEELAWYPIDWKCNLILIDLNDEPIFIPKEQWYLKWKTI
ncbi:MAG: hypothetical protein ACJATI_005237 [Halioglobus sp.]